MLKQLIGAAILIAVFHAQPAFSEQLTYDFSWTQNSSCYASNGASRNSEKRRRETITKYNLPKNLNWRYGFMKNEWGDHKDGFCYLEHGNYIYIWRPFHLIFLPDKPIEVVQLKR